MSTTANSSTKFKQSKNDKTKITKRNHSDVNKTSGTQDVITTAPKRIPKWVEAKENPTESAEFVSDIAAQAADNGKPVTRIIKLSLKGWPQSKMLYNACSELVPSQWNPAQTRSCGKSIEPAQDSNAKELTDNDGNTLYQHRIFNDTVQNHVRTDYDIKFLTSCRFEDGSGFSFTIDLGDEQCTKLLGYSAEDYNSKTAMDCIKINQESMKNWVCKLTVDDHGEIKRLIPVKHIEPDSSIELMDEFLSQSSALQ